MQEQGLEASTCTDARNCMHAQRDRSGIAKDAFVPCAHISEPSIDLYVRTDGPSDLAIA